MPQFNDKKIAILGFGQEGQATFEYFGKTQIKVAAVLDAKPELSPDLKSKLNEAGVDYIGGENYLDHLPEYEVIFRSPGIPRLHPKLLAYPDQEAIYSVTKLFFDLCPCPIIAVTGTKGKTTTASLMTEMLKTAGKKVFLGGNIGRPPLSFLNELTSDSVVVLELSSFQTQDLHKSPKVGVILNVTQDHLDDGTFRAASHSTQDEYLRAKAQLIAHQTEDDFAVLHPALGEIFRNAGQGKKIIINPGKYKNWERQLLGEHNLENIAAAAAACSAFGIPEEFLRTGVAAFTGVAQRLQVVGQKNGVKYVNDSASTNPDSTIAALISFAENIILIVGGSEKGLDYAPLGKKILELPNVKAIIAIGQIAPRILAAIKGFNGTILTGAADMKEIMKQANSVATSGDIVLLSPAAASFGMFENSKDRGNQFNKAVGDL
jgi:UDP-N-acetylmuramoylalanine--D-glutamate ligase